MLDGLAQGHQDRLYETVAPHILGDERFLETVSRRIAPAPTLSARPRPVAFGPLLNAVATVYTVTPRAILASGRQRAPVPARAMLVFLAREWGRLTTHDLGRRLQRDPSMISRLASAYAMHRDTRAEAQVRRALSTEQVKSVMTQARPPFRDAEIEERRKPQTGAAWLALR